MNNPLQMLKQVTFSDSTNLYDHSQVLVWTINRPCESLEEFWDIISKSLEFPEYFGRNWDACFDCLSSAAFYLKTDVWIIHETLPFQSAHDNFTWLRCVVENACIKDDGCIGIHRMLIT